MLCVLRDRHGHTPVSPMTGASSGLSPAAPCPSDVGCSTPSFALSCSQIQLWQERQWEPWCFLWETIPVHNAAPLGSSLLFLWALRDFQQGKQILLGLAGCSAQPRFLGCILPSWSLHMGQHPHKPSPCKEGTRAASVTRDKQHSEFGTAFLGDRDVQHQQQHSHNPGILSAHITPRTPGGTGCSAVPCPCSRCPGPGCVSMMGHIPLPHTCSCSAFQVTGPAAPDFSRLSHFWHLPSQSETQCFPLSPSIWNPGLEEFSY